MAKRIFEADIEAPSFIKTGGLASQYLKADGSVSTDSNAQLGANLFPYRIKTTIIGGDPTAGHLGYDNATQIDASKLYLNYLVEDGFDVRLFFEYFNIGDKLIIQDKDDSNNNQVWEITVIQNEVNHIQLNVTLISSSGTGTTNFANNHEVFMVRQATSVSSEGYIQRPVKFITTATYDFITADKDKTLVVLHDSPATTSIYLNQNTFAVNDEIELYDKTDTHKTRIYPGTGITIFHAGQTYANGQYFDFGSYMKIWLKCIDVNKFDVVYVYEGVADVGTTTTIDTIATLLSENILFEEHFLNDPDNGNLSSTSLNLRNAISGRDGGADSIGCAYFNQPTLWVNGIASSITQTTNYVFGLGDLTFKTRFKLNQLSTSAFDNFNFYMGFLYRPSFFAYFDNLYFSYNAFAGASPSLNWKVVARNGSGTTIIDTGVPVVANQFLTLKVIVKVNLSVEFYINEILVHTRASSAGIYPTGLPIVQMVRDIGEGQAERSAFVDYVRVYYKLTNPIP